MFILRYMRSLRTTRPCLYMIRSIAITVITALPISPEHKCLGDLGSSCATYTFISTFTPCPLLSCRSFWFRFGNGGKNTDRYLFLHLIMLRSYHHAMLTLPPYFYSYRASLHSGMHYNMGPHHPYTRNPNSIETSKSNSNPEITDPTSRAHRTRKPPKKQSVVLAHRPPISLPQTTVSPALLNELIGEISNLASVYHKPAETFIGMGRVGAEAVAGKKGGAEYVAFSFHVFASALPIYLATRHSPSDDRAATQKALQTVAAGQQAENLLDFDDEPSSLDGGGLGSQPTGLAATQVQALTSTPAAANLLAGTSSNPLDDLVSIFGSTGIGSAPSPVNGAGGMNGGMGGMGVMSPISTQQTPMQSNGVVSPTTTTTQNPQEDLLGLF